MKAKLFAPLALCATVLPGALWAAEDERPNSSTEGLNEIVVTAQKREERLADIPASISVLTSKDLENYSLTSLADYANYVPGLNIQGGDATGSARLILRGINDNDGGAPLVATYVDNFPVGASTGSTRGFQFPVDLLPYDLERIEVLRGPQGTLYGASAMGGLIKYVMRAPSLRELEVETGADVESIDHSGGVGRTFRAAVSGPLIDDKLGVRLSGFDRRSPGFIDNVGLGLKDENDSSGYGGRLAVLWTPLGALKVRGSALIQNTTSDMLQAVTLDTKTFRPKYGPYTVSTSLPDGYTTRSQIYSLDVEWDIGFATVDNTASYSKKDDIYTWDVSSLGALVPALTKGAYPAALLGYRFDLNLKKWTEELRLTSSSQARLQWMLGFFTTGEDTRNDQVTRGYTAPFTQPIANYADVLTASYPRTYRESAGFGDLTYTFTDHVDVTGGVRYASNRQHAHQVTHGLFVGPANFSPSSSGTSTTGSFSSRYHFNADNMVYVRVANGYRPGGPNVTYNNSAVPPSFEADKLVNYEIGFKGSLLDGRLVIDDSIFYIDWSDIQIPQRTTGNPPLAYTGNADSASSKGTELSLLYRPLESLGLGVALAYTDAHLTSDAPTLGGKNGDDLPGSPKFSGSLTADYSFPLRNGLSLTFGGAYRYRSPIETGLRSSPTSIEFPALKRHVDLYTDAKWKALTVRLYAKNLLKEQSYSGYAVPFTTNGYVVDPPRTIGISVDARL